MKHTSNWVSFVLFFAISGISQSSAQPALVQEIEHAVQSVQDAVGEAVELELFSKHDLADFVPALDFADYIGVIGQDSDDEHIRLQALRVKELLTQISGQFARGAFAATPLVQQKFEQLFSDIDTTKWPARRQVRAWAKRVSTYKKFLLNASFSAQSNASSSSLDNDTYRMLCQLNDFLKRYIFTDSFFDFTLAERTLDRVVFRPLEFVCDHPFIVAGVVVGVIVGGCVTYWYVHKKNIAADELEELRKLGVQVVLTNQENNECGLRALFHATYSQQKGPHYVQAMSTPEAKKAFEGFKEAVLRALNSMGKDERALSFMELSDMVAVVQNLKIQKPLSPLFIVLSNPAPIDQTDYTQAIEDFWRHPGRQVNCIVNTSRGMQQGDAQPPTDGHYFHLGLSSGSERGEADVIVTETRKPNNAAILEALHRMAKFLGVSNADGTPVAQPAEPEAVPVAMLAPVSPPPSAPSPVPGR
jgi:hypothetical protein